MPTIRFLTSEEILNLNPALAAKGWAELNLATSKVLGAFEAGELVEALALQLHPVIGPMIKTDATFNDGGKTSRELTEYMETYLKVNEARGWLVVCDNPFTERLCKKHGMRRVESPVYIWTPPEV